MKRQGLFRRRGRGQREKLCRGSFHKFTGIEPVAENRSVILVYVRLGKTGQGFTGPVIAPHDMSAGILVRVGI